MRIHLNDTGRYKYALVAKVGPEGRVIGVPVVARPGLATGGAVVAVQAETQPTEAYGEDAEGGAGRKAYA